MCTLFGTIKFNYVVVFEEPKNFKLNINIRRSRDRDLGSQLIIIIQPRVR